MNPTSFMHIFKRNRTSAKYVCYGLYLYFLGLSFRNTSKALSPFVLKEVMFQFGSGYSIIIHKKYIVKEKGFLNLSLMKP
jgi:hypothetical protein